MQKTALFIFFIFIFVLMCSKPHDPDLIAFPSPWSSPYQVDAQYPHHLVNDHNEHLYILNKTAWAYFECQYPEAVLQRAKAQGVTVLRVTLEGTPYEKVLGIDMWPWGGTRENPDWSTLNEAYWKKVEQRIRLAGEHGIGLDLCLYFTLKPEMQESDDHRLYWRNALDRLGKYANILCWEIHNEYVQNEVFQDIAGAFFHDNDPYSRPVITSDGTTDDAVWPHKSWVDMAINHTCTGSNYPLDTWYLALARNTRSYGKPAFCNESGREHRHNNDDGIHRRKQGWLWTHAGAYWTWHSWDGCEGIDSVDYVAPGGEFVKPMADYFQSLPFWTLNPNFTVLRIDTNSIITAALTDDRRALTTAYLCVEKTGATVPPSTALCRLPDGEYNIDFVDPASLETVNSLVVESSGLRRHIVIDIPTFTDDLLVKIVKMQEEERSRIPGTE